MATLVNILVGLSVWALLTKAIPRVTNVAQVLVGILAICGAMEGLKQILEVVKNVFNR